MKKLLVAAALSVAALTPAAPAAAQAPSWNAEQTAVWNLVTQSWADEAARSGKWPGSYVHDRFVAFDAGFPMPRYRNSFERWARWNDGQRQIVNYEIAPAAITIAGDTAVVHYTGVTMEQRGTDKPTREMFGVSETLVRQGGQWKFLTSSGWEMGK